MEIALIKWRGKIEGLCSKLNHLCAFSTHIARARSGQTGNRIDEVFGDGVEEQLREDIFDVLETVRLRGWDMYHVFIKAV